MKMRTVKLSLGVFVFMFLLIVLGSVFMVGEKIGSFSSLLAWIFYGISGGLFAVGALWPLGRMLFTPALEGITPRDAEASPEEVMGYAKWLKRTLRLSEEEKIGLLGMEPRQCINRLLEERYQEMEKIVRHAATEVFMITALSQNGKLDFISAVVMDFRMISALVHCLGVRPTGKQLIKLYVAVFSASLITGMVDNIIGKIDFTTWCDGILGKILKTGFSSVFSGLTHAFVTLRIGYATIAYLQKGSKKFKVSSVKGTIVSRARVDLEAVVRDGTFELWNKGNKLFAFFREDYKEQGGN